MGSTFDMNLPTAMQGEGTYTYECDKPDCAWCEAMKPKLIAPVELPVYKSTGPHLAWTVEEVDFVMANLHLSYRLISRLMGTKTQKAVASKLYKLRQRGFAQKSMDQFRLPVRHFVTDGKYGYY